jgi:site-specific recombinase XerD
MRAIFRLVRDRGRALPTIRPVDVAAWVEQLQEKHGAAGVKQQLAAVRMLFDWLITGQVVPLNPAAAVRGPKHVVKTGKTPVLDAGEWRKLMDSIPTETVRDLRDRALIATLTYSFARITAATQHEGGRLAAEGLGLAAPVARERRQASRDAVPSRARRGAARLHRGGRMDQSGAWTMMRRRAAAAGIHAPIGNHTFRATGITAYLGNGGALEHAQTMAAHESPRTTKLYDRTKDRLTQDEVERIRL